MVVCYWSTHQYNFLRANCNMASVKPPMYQSCAAGLWSEAGRRWSWWWVQLDLPVYRTLASWALYPQPPSSFLIMFLKSYSNHSVKTCFSIPKSTKILSIFCLSCSGCIPPPSLPHQLSDNAGQTLGQVTGSAQANSPALQVEWTAKANQLKCVPFSFDRRCSQHNCPCLLEVSLGSSCVPLLLLSPCSSSFLQPTCFCSLIIVRASPGEKTARTCLLLPFWTLDQHIPQQLPALAHAVFGTWLWFLCLMALGLG